MIHRTEEEIAKLLEFANQKYPAGTKFLSECRPKRSLLEGSGLFKYDNTSFSYEVIWNIDKNGGRVGFIYNSGIWAEILDDEFLIFN